MIFDRVSEIGVFIEKIKSSVDKAFERVIKRAKDVPIYNFLVDGDWVGLQNQGVSFQVVSWVLVAVLVTRVVKGKNFLFPRTTSNPEPIPLTTAFLVREKLHVHPVEALQSRVIG